MIVVYCLGAYIQSLFLYFWHCHSYILQHFYENVLLLFICEVNANLVYMFRTDRASAHASP